MNLIIIIKFIYANSIILKLLFAIVTNKQKNLPKKLLKAFKYHLVQIKIRITAGNEKKTVACRKGAPCSKGPSDAQLQFICTEM